jgi:hypothetical protein
VGGSYLRLTPETARVVDMTTRQEISRALMIVGTVCFAFTIGDVAALLMGTDTNTFTYTAKFAIILWISSLLVDSTWWRKRK